MCYFDWQCGLGQHLCGLLRSDSMITTCMFSTLKVAVNLAFCPLPAISLATGGSCFLRGNARLLIFLLGFCEKWAVKVIACPSGCLTDWWCLDLFPRSPVVTKNLKEVQSNAFMAWCTKGEKRRQNYSHFHLCLCDINRLLCGSPSVVFVAPHTWLKTNAAMNLRPAWL